MRGQTGDLIDVFDSSLDFGEEGLIEFKVLFVDIVVAVVTVEHHKEDECPILEDLPGIHDDPHHGEYTHL